MKNILISIALNSALAVAQPQPRYIVTDLGPAGNPFSQATALNNKGIITGLATAPNGTQHAVLWYKGTMMDLCQPGLGGPNTGAIGVNETGQIAVEAETLANDPHSENFCGYGPDSSGTIHQCLGALWQDGVLSPLPTLGGGQQLHQCDQQSR